MIFSNLFGSTNGTSNMLVKIVHPGGHAELHDKPVLAAEIMLRNPRHCVAHPHVFQQPWAVVAPDTTLMPGQKFYIVPTSTIRKLRKLFSYSSSMSQEIQSSQSCDGVEDDRRVSTCWFLLNKKTAKMTNSCTKQSDGKRKKLSLDDKCSSCLLTVINIKASPKETRSSSTMDVTIKGDSLKGSASFNTWQPTTKSREHSRRMKLNSLALLTNKATIRRTYISW